MACTANQIVKQMVSWIGCKESDGSHKKIIDVYNSHKPLARGYKLKYTDPWCAGTVSAAAIACGATDIIPTEVSCSKMIELCKEKGIWHENENYVPDPADIIFYDWDDNGVGDNKGGSDHVGFVEKVSGDTITAIEGNYGDAVKRRTLKVNGRYIRGYALPKYDNEEIEDEKETSSGTSGTASKPTTTTKPTTTKTKKATEPAKSFDKSLAGTYKVTASSGLNVRNGAGTSKKKLVAIPKGTKVKNYGYYTKVGGVIWLYVQFTYGGVTYTGFCSKKYLSRA